MKSLLVCLALLLFCLPAFAQDPTPESTPDASPVTVNVEPNSDGSIWGIVALVVTSIMAIVTSISLALQSVGNRARQIVSNPLTQEILDKAHDSIPASVLHSIVDPLKASLERSDEALKNVIDLLRMLSEGKPEEERVLPRPAHPPPAETIASTGNDPFVSTSTHNLPSPATDTPNNG